MNFNTFKSMDKDNKNSIPDVENGKKDTFLRVANSSECVPITLKPTYVTSASNIVMNLEPLNHLPDLAIQANLLSSQQPARIHNYFPESSLENREKQLKLQQQQYNIQQQQLQLKILQQQQQTRNETMKENLQSRHLANEKNSKNHDANIINIDCLGKKNNSLLKNENIIHNYQMMPQNSITNFMAERSNKVSVRQQNCPNAQKSKLDLTNISLNSLV